ncbi:hypothetical protein B0D71_19085 [Pseudomonas laurylsulfativorans]|uniref:Uncharacterized protein n=1 Tax=Pseudomonas laurylsulfativorans TaxID=1943631 RepID=A0A2S3VL20_9PSED|nr:hypothetical protein B0D71_19085 [Pseudomonas laurylsulfativorans]
MAGSKGERVPVGASLLAMDVNDNAGSLIPRGVPASIASLLAPTGCKINQSNCACIQAWYSATPGSPSRGAQCANSPSPTGR